MNDVCQACKAYVSQVALKKTSVMGQGFEEAPSISICSYALEGGHQFTYLGYRIMTVCNWSQNITDEFGEHQQLCLY